MRYRVDQGVKCIQSDFRMNPWQNHKLPRKTAVTNIGVRRCVCAAPT